MTPLTHVRVDLPCPSCGERRRLVVALCLPATSTRVADPGDAGMPEGHHRGELFECPKCWCRRVEVMQDEKRRLRASGELGRLAGEGQDTWLGVPLGRDDDGAFEGAVASALLKAGLGPPSVPVELRLRDGQAALEREPLVPAGA